MDFRLSSTGLLLINKPLEWTSFDVVAKVRNLLKAKKVGHTGTLDPLSTGVLVLCVGKATKLIEFMVGMDKEYEAEITLGAVSDTDDAEGPIQETENAPEVSREALETILQRFVGEIQQMPPVFSAKKVGGKKAYQAARAGKPLQLKPAGVVIHSIDLLDYRWPTFRIRVHCGKGTYIRSLARDIGKALTVGGYLSALTRTRVGPFALKDCIGIPDVAPEKLMPLSAILPQLPPRARLKV